MEHAGEVDEESLDVTQCRTRTEKRTAGWSSLEYGMLGWEGGKPSALQSSRQIHAASPRRTNRTVRLLKHLR